jgi:hypothetical protein
MIGLREDQREKAQLVGKINALFPEWRDTFVANGLVVVRRLAPSPQQASLATHNGLLQESGRRLGRQH